MYKLNLKAIRKDNAAIYSAFQRASVRCEGVSGYCGYHLIARLPNGFTY